jgi:hypothetical protein
MTHKNDQDLVFRIRIFHWRTHTRSRCTVSLPGLGVAEVLPGGGGRAKCPRVDQQQAKQRVATMEGGKGGSLTV